MTEEELKKIVPGDRVVRNMVGVYMTLNVSTVDDTLIHCGPWTFDRTTGAEIDEDLGWTAHRSGSMIEKVEPKAAEEVSHEG